jgi:hypothetical protein
MQNLGKLIINEQESRMRLELNFITGRKERKGSTQLVTQLLTVCQQRCMQGTNRTLKFKSTLK